MLINSTRCTRITRTAVFALLALCFLHIPIQAQSSDYKALVCVFIVDGNSPVAQSREITITPGKFHSFDVDRDNLTAEGEPGTGRLQVRVEIRFRLASGAEPDESILVLKSAPVGLTRGEKLRVNVFNPNEPDGELILPDRFPTSFELVDNSTGKTSQCLVFFLGGRPND
jgi:hypothetical protein